MASLNPGPVGTAWTLIYDASISGDFNGLISPTNGDGCIVRVSDSVPPPIDPGAQLSQQFKLSLSGADKLWGRSITGNARVQLDNNFVIAGATFPDGIFEGNRAITVQGYTEANVKDGVEYEYSIHDDAVIVGDAVCFAVSIGSKPMLIKIVNLGIDGTEATYQIFRSPTYTGGTPGTIFNRNDRNPVPGEITVTDSPAVTVEGAPVSAPFVFIGSAGQGQSNPATGGTIGLDHLLAPNTEYLFCFKNTGIETEKMAMFVGWYEGTTDLPLP